MENIAEVKKDFFRFLKEKGIYRSFINEFKKINQTETRIFWCEETKSHFYGKPNETFVDYIRQIKNKEEIINYAFDWDESKEGHDFWSMIDTIWREGN